MPAAAADLGGQRADAQVAAVAVQPVPGVADLGTDPALGPASRGQRLQLGVQQVEPLGPAGRAGQPVQQRAGAAAEQRGEVDGVAGQLAGRHPEQRPGPAPGQLQLQPGLPVAHGDLGRPVVQAAHQRDERAG